MAASKKAMKLLLSPGLSRKRSGTRWIVAPAHRRVIKIPGSGTGRKETQIMMAVSSVSSHAVFGPLGRICRLGLASRSDGTLSEEDVLRALDGGVNVLNWPGEPDVLSRTVAGLGPRRRDVVVCVQF